MATRRAQAAAAAAATAARSSAADDEPEAGPLLGSAPAGPGAAAVAAAAPAEERAYWLGITPQLFIVYFNIALYAAAFQMQIPTQPYMIKALSSSSESGASAAMTFGIFKSYMSALQLVGSLLSGVLIDRLGSKRIFALSFLVSAISYQLTAYATTLPLLYASQLPTIFQHAVLGARAFVTVTTTEQRRASHMGFVMVAYGIGMVVGPTAGGLLSGGEHSYWLVSTVAAALSALSVVLVLTMLDDPLAAPVSAPDAQADATAATEAGITPPAARDYLSIFLDGNVTRLLCIKLLFSGAGALFHSVFPLVAIERFGLDAKGMGFMLSFVGVLSMITNGLLVHPAEKAFSERALLLSTGAALAACFALFAVTDSALQLYALCVPMVVASGLFQTVSSAQLTRLVRRELAGTANALDMGISSGVRMISPMAAGYMLSSSVGFVSVGASSSLLMASCFVLLLALQVPAVSAAATAKKH